MNLRGYRAMLITASLVIACGSTPEPSVPAVGNVFSVNLHTMGSGTTITAHVVDQVGIVVGALKADPAQLHDAGDASANALPESSGLLVTWFGGVCRLGPTITLAGTADDLVVRLEPEAGPGPPGGSCIDIGLYYGVQVALSQPVQQAALTLQAVR